MQVNLISSNLKKKLLQGFDGTIYVKILTLDDLIMRAGILLNSPKQNKLPKVALQKKIGQFKDNMVHFAISSRF